MRRGKASRDDWLVSQLREAKQEASSWSEWKSEAMRFERILPYGSTEAREHSQEGEQAALRGHTPDHLPGVEE
jgi:hypothetical protein